MNEDNHHTADGTERLARSLDTLGASFRDEPGSGFESRLAASIARPPVAVHGPRISGRRLLGLGAGLLAAAVLGIAALAVRFSSIGGVEYPSAVDAELLIASFDVLDESTAPVSSLFEEPYEDADAPAASDTAWTDWLDEDWVGEPWL